MELLSRPGTGEAFHCVTVSANLRPYTQVPEVFDRAWNHNVHIHVVDGLRLDVLMPASIALLGTAQAWKVPEQIAIMVGGEQSSI